MTVLGFGEKKTPDAFRNACHKFLFTEVLRPSESQSSDERIEGAVARSEKLVIDTPQRIVGADTHQNAFPKDFVLEALEKASDDKGWAHLGTFGSYLTKLQPDFDSRLYGFKKLSDLVKGKKDIFECEERTAPGSENTVLYVRAR